MAVFVEINSMFWSLFYGCTSLVLLEKKNHSAAWHYRISVKGPSNFQVLTLDLALCPQIFRSTYWVERHLDACQLET